MRLDSIFKTPEKYRGRLRVFRKKKRYDTDKRKHFSRAELVEYLRTNNFQSTAQLEAGRKRGDPKVYDYAKEFGNWQNAKTTVFGFKPEFGFSDTYIVHAIVECGLWTVREYQAKRNQMPDTFPSVYKIRKQFGCFSVLKGSAKLLSMKATMMEYKKLWRRLGRAPSFEEARAAGIVLESTLKVFRKKKELDDFILNWETDNAGKAGSS